MKVSTNSNIPLINFSFKSPGIFMLFLLFMILAFLIMIPVPRVDNHLIGSDGCYYYSYMRSFILDRDLDIVNDLALYNSRMASEDNPARATVPLYHWSIGPSLLWTPFFVAGHLLVLLLNLAGAGINPDGFSYVEEGFISIGSIIYAVLGLFLLYKTLSKFFTENTSLIAAFAVFLGTPGFYYPLFEPSMSHAVEFFSVSLLFYLLFYKSGNTVRDWFFIGLASGLVSIVRWQNIIFLLLCVYALWREIIDNQFKQSYIFTIKKIIAGLFGFFPVVFLQTLFWKATLGYFLLIPQGDGFLRFTQPYIIEVLFSSRNGLFLWSPIAICIIGLLFFKKKGLAVICAAIFLMDVYVCSIVWDWWGGFSFGARRLVGALPIFAFGLGAIYERWKKNSVRGMINIFLICSVLWNFAFILQYRLGFIPKGSYLTFDQIVWEKILLIPQIWKLIFG